MTDNNNREQASFNYVNAAFVSAIVFIIILFIFIGKYSRAVVTPETYVKVLMGTFVEISLKNESQEKADLAFNKIAELEQIFSSYISTSDISKINKNAGIKPVKVSPHVMEVVKKALYVANISDGAFDPTFGPFTKIYNFTPDEERIPTDIEIEKALRLINYKDVIIDEEKQTVMLKRKSMMLNLGGIAKGYIVDEAIKVLKANQVTWAIVKAGGDMVYFQSGKLARVVKIGLQHPRVKGELLGKFKVLNASIATSGDYERFFIKNGVRYHHIIDPKTGKSASKSMSVTIINKTDDPAISDGLSTAVFVLGPEKGIELIESLDRIDAIIVGADNSIRTTKGLTGSFAHIDMENSMFSFMEPL